MTMATSAGSGGDSRDGPGEGGKGSSSGIPAPAPTQQRIRQEHPQPAPGTTASAATTAATASAHAREQTVNTVSNLPMADTSYVELGLIGNGAYGTVYLGRDRTNEERLVALKKIRITLVEDGVPVSALREIALLKQLEKFEHPNIVRLLDICHGRIERDSRLTLILVFEYVEQDLDTYLKNCPSPGLEQPRIKSLMHQVLCGVDFLHTNRIIHRDLKPQNLLVDRCNRVKIADFGLARIYDFHMRLTTMVVTLWYRAPEVLLSNSYATPVDIWSCGCIFAELFRRKPVFEGQTEGDQLQRIFDIIGKPRESEWPSDVSLSLANFRDHIGRPLEEVVPEIPSDAADLLRKLWKFVPGSRIPASEALSHPYFRGLCAPRVSASARSTPSQQLSPPPPSLTTLSTLTEQQRSSTVSTTTLTSSTPAVPSSVVTSQTINLEITGHISANDENNPNTGNNSSNNTIAGSSLGPEPKPVQRSDSTSPNNDQVYGSNPLTVGTREPSTRGSSPSSMS